MSASLCLDGAAAEAVRAFFEPRADAVDRCEATVREGIAFLHDGLIPCDATEPNAELERVARTVATVAWSDLASAFSLWSHRMVLEYLAGGAHRDRVDRLLAVRALGSTALAGPMAHHLGQTRLALAGASEDGGLVVDGRIRWASNLFAPDFVLVSAAVVDGALVPFVTDGAAPGLAVDPYPELVALQATGSSSLRLERVPVPSDQVLAEGFAPFVARVRPTFLVLQSSFCWGLARRALDEAGSAMGGTALVFREDLAALVGEAGRLAELIQGATSTRSTTLRELVRVRLGAARLAVAATALEAKVIGSRSFVRGSPTARRLREAAFLPIQTPTEGQLRSELAPREELAAAR
ncbi:MAG TPA: acyl-CoA dehydrogenase [Candidatus Limnocylindria bacterium]|jgi:alkylation response protein AidB-like acyl-CoA dehydrogenase|nr:acyl-CoA dehydrogenase [Candidatus Limnocylindria bacterium]